MNEKVLTPEIKTVIDMMELLSRDGQEKVVDVLYDVISEVDADEKWKILLKDKSEPMKNLARQALEEHRQNKTRPFKP